MNIEPDKIYKVFHTIWYKGKNEGKFITDLQVEYGKYYLVFNWTTTHDGEYPSYRHEIDSSLLVPLGLPNQDFLIEMPVKLPDHPVLTKLIQEAKSRQ
jgi:hypothetical protein